MAHRAHAQHCSHVTGIRLTRVHLLRKNNNNTSYILQKATCFSTTSLLRHIVLYANDSLRIYYVCANSPDFHLAVNLGGNILSISKPICKSMFLYAGASCCCRTVVAVGWNPNAVIFWMKASPCACDSINVTQYTSAQSISFLSKATCFDLKLVIFRPLQHFSLPDALPTLGSRSVYSCGMHLS